MRRRLDELRGLFREQGARLTSLRDPLAAASVGAALSAPFLSITDLRGRPAREAVLDSVAATGTPTARAALLALAVATDGQLESLAGGAAARMDPVREPPWARKARSPLRLLATDRLLDRDDPRITALVVTVAQGHRNACFFLRFHPASLLTAQILYLPGTGRTRLLADLAAGRGPAAPFRFPRRLNVADDRNSLISLVGAMIEENDVNLRRGREFPPYPPALTHLSRVSDVTVVPALLVLLRKFLLSAYGIRTWRDVDRHTTAWL